MAMTCRFMMTGSGSTSSYFRCLSRTIDIDDFSLFLKLSPINICFYQIAIILRVHIQIHIDTIALTLILTAVLAGRQLFALYLPLCRISMKLTN